MIPTLRRELINGDKIFVHFLNKQARPVKRAAIFIRMIGDQKAAIRYETRKTATVVPLETIELK